MHVRILISLMNTLVSNSDERILAGASSELGRSILSQLNYARVLLRLTVISQTISALVSQI
jgi:hypothetical protein